MTARNPRAATPRTLAAALAAGLSLVACPASAYVVVTMDNKVLEVSSKPELRGSLVLFTLDGAPVSLRIYDVNIAKTNELNALLDRGASGREVLASVRALPRATPVDDRIIVASRLHRDMIEAGENAPTYRVIRGDVPASPSFDRDAPGPRRPPRQQGARASSSRVAAAPAERPSPFAAEARRAMADAERQVQSSRTAEAPARPAPPPADRRADRAAELDAEIAAEQAYLRQLTAGEVTVDDLDAEIERSMAKVRKLQKKRDAMSSGGEAPAREASARETVETRNPAGSREAKWEQELAEKEARLQDLRAQQASASGEERETLDYLVAETEFAIEKLRRKLERAGGN